MSAFLRAYLTVVFFGGVAGLFMALTLGIGRVLRPNNPNRQKQTNYESGVDPVGSFFAQSQVRYYIFALLFVMFDVEAVFIFPWAVGLERYGAYGLGVMGLFVFILTLPLLYAWRKGVLRWV